MRGEDEDSDDPRAFNKKKSLAADADHFAGRFDEFYYRYHYFCHCLYDDRHCLIC